MTIKKLFFVIAIEFLIISAASSNEVVPIFNDDTLRIPTVDSLEESGKFQDVIFKLNEKGEWLLLDYKAGKEIQNIKEVEIIQTETFPIQVFLKVSGYFSNGCRNIGQIRHKLVENNFEVFIYYGNNKKFPPEEFTCTTAIVPFSEIIPLPIYSLKEGMYGYTVNGGFKGVFDLASDNGL